MINYPLSVTLSGVETLGFIKTLIFGAMIGFLLGMWIGINVGKNRDLLTNPFDTSVSESSVTNE